MSLVEKIFGSFSDRELKKVNPIVKQVLALEPKYAALSDAELQAQTPAFKQQLADGKTLDDILPDAFAVCREAAWRVLGMKHFPVQITGGIALHRGDIAEMQTGEGKTLVATLPAYLNALTGEGVHVVTVNDYLAKRDSEWMGKLYRWLGLSVGLIAQGMDGDARRAAYAADITYGTNNEFGFDYLRDNMVTYKANMVQRGHAFAIVDEVDSILIDEARTPLIISGKGEDSSSLYTQVDRFARTLRKSVVVELEDKVSTDEQADGDYVVDEKHKTCTLTAAGIKKAEAYFKVENLAAAENMTLAHHIDQAIKAYGVMQRDIDYVVKDGQVIIVDEFTGRLMYGRRYNEGLHQAIEIGQRAREVARHLRHLLLEEIQLRPGHVHQVALAERTQRVARLEVGMRRTVVDLDGLGSHQSVAEYLGLGVGRNMVLALDGELQHDLVAARGVERKPCHGADLHALHHDRQRVLHAVDLVVGGIILDVPAENVETFQKPDSGPGNADHRHGEYSDLNFPFHISLVFISQFAYPGSSRRRRRGKPCALRPAVSGRRHGYRTRRRNIYNGTAPRRYTVSLCCGRI